MRKAELLQSLESTEANVHITGYVLMNCQRAVSSEMSQLVKHLTTSCDVLRTKVEMSFRSHCFLMYLLEKFPDVPAVQWRDVQRAVQHEGVEKLVFVPD